MKKTPIGKVFKKGLTAAEEGEGDEPVETVAGGESEADRAVRESANLRLVTEVARECTGPAIRIWSPSVIAVERSG